MPTRRAILTPALIAALNTRGGRARRDPREQLVTDLWLVGLPAPVLEYRFHPVRKWAIDLAFPDRKLAVEIEGLVYSNRGDNQLIGRHVSVTGFVKDCEKYAELAIAGWRLIRVTSAHALNGTALRWIERALKENPE